MKRHASLALAGLLLGLAACTIPELSDLEQDRARTCDEAHPCRPGYACVAGLCQVGSGPASDGGIVCAPTCGSSEVCTAAGCVGRFSQLTLLAPAEGALVSSDTLEVEARLDVKPEYAQGPGYPDRLVYSVERDGTEVGDAVLPVGMSGGVYTARWTPQLEGHYRLTASVPGGGPSATVSLSVDRVAPSIALLVPEPSTGNRIDGQAGWTTYADLDPDAGVVPSAWRRDQEVWVEVRVSDAHLQAGSVALALSGTDGIAVNQPLEPLAACDVAYCGRALLRLWEPRFDAFRGTLALEASARDELGHATRQLGTLPVTRFKWMYESAGSLTAVALGAQGTLYFGNNAQTGKGVALRPDGREKWVSNWLTGTVSNAPIAGAARDGGSESVYFPVNPPAGGSRIHALHTASGVGRAVCPPQGTYGYVSPALALSGAGEGGWSKTETALGIDGTSPLTLVGISPDAPPEEQCLQVTLHDSGRPTYVEWNSGLIVNGDHFFYSAPGSNSVYSHAFQGPMSDTGRLLPRDGWPVTIPGLQGQMGGQLAFTASRLVVATETNGLYTVPTSNPDGGVPLAQTRPTGDGGTQPQPWSVPSQLTVAPGDDLYLGHGLFNGSRGTVSQLSRLPLDGGTARSIELPFPLYAGVAPVLGKGGLLYGSTSRGQVGAWDTPNLTARWQLTPPWSESLVSPTLDCARDEQGRPLRGRPGILYVSGRSTLTHRLLALVVDSESLDPTAPWPKYQHDARNTANPATPVTDCQ